jgi:hypothetical protein
MSVDPHGLCNAKCRSVCVSRRLVAPAAVPRRHARPICRAGPSDCSGRGITDENADDPVPDFRA